MAKRRTTIAPAITRVHRLHRIRTIINDSAKMKKVTQYEIGKILVKRRLSKKSILKDSNRLRRARDHAMNSTYLGFLVPTRTRHGYVYTRTPVGQKLSKYGFRNPCPNDSLETAIFLDRLCRMKLTNPYDSRGTYRDYKTRPVLSILHLLRSLRMHISQIHYALGVRSDLVLDDKKYGEMARLLRRYPITGKRSAEKFMKDFKLTQKRTRAEIERSTKPLLEWCRQAGLVVCDGDKWYNLTEIGDIAVATYSSLRPVWFGDLGMDGLSESALLFAFQHARLKGKSVQKGKLSSYLRELLGDLQNEHRVFDRKLSTLKVPLDYDLHYDVPVKMRADVMELGNDLSRRLGLGRIDYGNLVLDGIGALEEKIETTGNARQASDLARALGVRIPPQHCFQTPFEWETCVRLIGLGLPASPYNGEFEAVYNPRISSRNPDIYIQDGLRALVECKSKEEWGQTVRMNKRVKGELLVYQSYADGVGATSAFFVCGASQFEGNFVEAFSAEEKEFQRLVVSTYDYLEDLLRDETKRQKLVRMLKNPMRFGARKRILST